MMRHLVLSLLVAVACCPAYADFDDQRQAVIAEHLGHDWPISLVRQSLHLATPGPLFPGKTGLFHADVRVPMQLTDVVAHDDGSIREATVWFRTDLPAGASKTFTLQPVTEPEAASELSLTTEGNVHLVANAHTAMRLPAGAWTAPEGDVDVGAALAAHLGVPADPGYLPAPLLGVRLPSGQWAAATKLQPAGRLTGYRAEIVEAGPLIVRARVRYEFAPAGFYEVELTMHSDEPLVRIDERYEQAGVLVGDLGSNLQPTRFATKADSRGRMQLADIDYAKGAALPRFVGWDYYLADRTAVLGFLGGPRDDLLALMSTSADWMPDPYAQMMSIVASAPQQLDLRGPLADGHRHWAILAGRGADFPEPGRDLYRWWNRHIAFPLAKIATWQLVWPGMDEIAFPHTFFSTDDLPAIREQLQAEPTIRAFMEADRAKADDGYLGWKQKIQAVKQWDDDERRQLFERYQAAYRERGGTARGVAYASAHYLFSGDRVFLEQMVDRTGFDQQTPQRYAERFVACYLDDIGHLAGNGAMGNMNVSDSMLQLCLAYDLALGSDLLSRDEKRTLLTQIAFMVYVMHDPWWQPWVHMPDGSRPEGYGQGTPNQKHCAFSCRAMTACMLANHPAKQAWLRFAMAELRPHYSYTIHESGALLESPFYSSRDTMRYGPFWRAMVRAGVADVATDYREWMNRPKRVFVYLANMLTPREPRMGDARVYHPIGRSGPGVIDPTFMIGGDPWADDDPAHGALMRWCWEEQGKPLPDIMGATGGRNLALTLLAFSQRYEPLTENPLRSQRWEGMGATLRSNPATDYESNLVFRHDPFCWDLYPVNNGAVYFYGKGAPLLPRFGAYWSQQHGGAWMMGLPFGNRVEFAQGDNRASGRTTRFVSLGELADVVAGVTHDGHWQRTVLFAKDASREDPVYLLVRDDVDRPGSASVANWWVMARQVQSDGLTKPGVVPITISDREWVANLGRNWEKAARVKADANAAGKQDAAAELLADEAPPKPSLVPVLRGQYHFFEGMCGVDLDMFIAVPSEPEIVTDAASAGRFPYCVTKGLYETQQLVRVSQAPGGGFLTLFMPRLPGSATPTYRTIAGGNGVAIAHADGEDRLFLGRERVAFQDDQVDFDAVEGFVRRGPLRLMVSGGRIAADGFTLEAEANTVLIHDGKAIRVFTDGDPRAVRVTVPDALRQVPIDIGNQ